MYVFALSGDARGIKGLQQYSRLYPFPVRPEPPPVDGLVILDSGAPSLFRQGKRMDERYMRRLAGWYRKYAGERVRCIAPDVCKDPFQTMRNFAWWQRVVDLPVVPVIQPRIKKLDIFLVLRQAQFYRDYRSEWIAISNGTLHSSEADQMAEVCKVVRAMTGATWLHCLGAGWNPLDAKGWFDLGFDSIDSTAYLTDAKRGCLWRAWGRESQIVDWPWQDIVVANAAAIMDTLACEGA